MAAILAWLYANCAGNLVASAITGSAVWLWARRKILHLHRRLDAHHELLQQIHDPLARPDGR